MLRAPEPVLAFANRSADQPDADRAHLPRVARAGAEEKGRRNLRHGPMVAAVSRATRATGPKTPARRVTSKSPGGFDLSHSRDARHSAPSLYVASCGSFR